VGAGHGGDDAALRMAKSVPRIDGVKIAGVARQCGGGETGGDPPAATLNVAAARAHAGSNVARAGACQRGVIRATSGNENEVIKLTVHGRARLLERGVALAWVEARIAQPDFRDKFPRMRRASWSRG
jgi:hypothetical protein